MGEENHAFRIERESGSKKVKINEAPREGELRKITYDESYENWDPASRT